MTRRLPPSRRNRQSAAALPLRLMVLAAWALSRTAAAAVSTVTEVLAGGCRMPQALCTGRRRTGRTMLRHSAAMHVVQALRTAAATGLLTSSCRSWGV